MIKALNESFMEASESKAREGLMNLTRTTLFPGIPIYRFGNTERPDFYFTGPWWLGFSPFEALKQFSKSRGQSLTLAARQSLAIDWGWSKVDVLIKAAIKHRLLAWAGTPKTQVTKVGSRYGIARWNPDRDVTQLYIPGLSEADPNDPSRKIWQNAFIGPWLLHIPSDTGANN